MWTAIMVVAVLGVLLGFGFRTKPKVQTIPQPRVTSMNSDDFVEYALDVIDANEKQRERLKKNQYSDPRGNL